MNETIVGALFCVLQNISDQCFVEIFAFYRNFDCFHRLKQVHYKKYCVRLSIQLAFTCWKSTIETLEKSVKYVQN